MAERDSASTITIPPAANSGFLESLVGEMVNIDLIIGDYKTLRGVVGVLVDVQGEYLLIRRPGGDRLTLVYKHAIALVTPSSQQVPLA